MEICDCKFGLQNYVLGITYLKNIIFIYINDNYFNILKLFYRILLIFLKINVIIINKKGNLQTIEIN
jgi:hypothetical protein